MSKPTKPENVPPTAADFGGGDRLIPLPVVMEISGLGRAMIYRKMKAGTFPKQCKPGGASSRWSEHEIRGWVADQLAARAA